MAYENLFCMTALAQVRCSAELDMFSSAKEELNEMGDFWNGQARRIADKLIIQKDPERFLAGEFAKDVPAAKIAAWLDFVHDEEKGMGWVDEMRAKSAPYYRPRVQLPRLNFGGRTLKQDQTELIPALNQLVTRPRCSRATVRNTASWKSASSSPPSMRPRSKRLAPMT